MRIAFRVDASREIGVGHFMRCLTLADTLSKSGTQTHFVCRNLPKYLRALLVHNHHEIVLLDSATHIEQLDELSHSYFLGRSQQQDAIETLEAIAGGFWDWFIVDHYALDNRYETALREVASNIMVIDDIADRVHDCDILLDQNIFTDMEDRYISKVPETCRLLLGPKFALLREEFRKLREMNIPGNGQVNRVLVFFGGFDPDNLTGRSIRALSKLNIEVLNVDVVIGAKHAYRTEIEEYCKVHRYECHVQTTQMAELIAVANLAIGAGGSSSWERCCLGLATIAVAFADNQFDIAASLDKVGACIFLGNQKAATQNKIENALAMLISDHKRLSEISMKAYSLVDGCGAERVRDAIYFN